MSVFADSSAVVKLYADEPGADAVREIEEVLTVSRLTRVEVASALWRKERTGEVGRGDVATLILDFEADWLGTATSPSRFQPVAVTAELCADAARLVAVHGLRAYDAVQLATALRVRHLHPQIHTFAAFDADLSAAAAAEGFTPLPESPPG